MLLFSFVGLLLLRLDEAKLLELLFQLPPRKPRYELARWARTPAFLPPGQNRAAKSVTLRMAGVGHPGADALRYLRRLGAAVSQFPEHFSVSSVKPPHAGRSHADAAVGAHHEPGKFHTGRRRCQAVLIGVNLQPQFGQLLADLSAWLFRMCHSRPRSRSSAITRCKSRINTSWSMEGKYFRTSHFRA